jgi:hypothetical protein
MALNKAGLEAAILAALTKQANKTNASDDPAVSRQELASDIATAIETFVKSGLVSTTVTGTSPSGPVTGTGTGSIS